MAAGGTVTVTITATSYGRFGRVTETLPDGFSYVSSTLTMMQVSEDGQAVEFTLQGADDNLHGTPLPPRTRRVPMSFSGTLRDSDKADHDVVGAASVTVLGPRATRSFSPRIV